MTTTLSVLIVDDDLLFARGLARFFRFSSARFAVDAGSGVMMAQQESPDLILLDQYLPDGLGVDYLASLREAAPRAAIVVLTAHPDAVEDRALAGDEPLAGGVAAKDEPWLLWKVIEYALAERRRASSGAVSIRPILRRLRREPSSSSGGGAAGGGFVLH